MTNRREPAPTGRRIDKVIATALLPGCPPLDARHPGSVGYPIPHASRHYVTVTKACVRVGF
ncbi:hypothetical protein [Mycolicibacterium chubuense]|uniref:hypothetical protein n=1 Tax=Mycolicibacterium chubuense TaxID=1800 RepID=UPI0002EE029A|nr:hypothetical protein [Mycolicibacterium chubuense]